MKSANNILNQSLISPTCYQHIMSPRFVTNIEVTVMLVTEFRYWWHLLNVGVRRFCNKIMNVGDQNGQKRHQHLIFDTITFCLQHPSPKSVKPDNDLTNQRTRLFWAMHTSKCNIFEFETDDIATFGFRKSSETIFVVWNSSARLTSARII